MKKLIVSVLLVLLLVTGCGKVSLKNGEEAVVDLKEGAISVDTLYSKMKDRYALNILLDLIDTEILEKKYASSEEETTYITQMKEQSQMLYNYYYSQQYSSYSQFLLEQYGVTTDAALDPVFSLRYKRNKAVEDYAKSKVSNSEIEKYYETNVVGDMKVSHILITVDAGENATDEVKENAKTEAYNKAKEVIEKLDKGEDFAALAKEYSKDSSKTNGGDIGYFNDGDNEENFFKAAKKLKVGEYTKEPVETKYGYHIIKLTDQKKKEELSKVKDKIVEKLANEKIEADSNIRYKALIELREKSNISIKDSDLQKQYNNYVLNYK
jgi:foldase protein PrsA